MEDRRHDSDSNSISDNVNVMQKVLLSKKTHKRTLQVAMQNDNMKSYNICHSYGGQYLCVTSVMRTMVSALSSPPRIS